MEFKIKNKWLSLGGSSQVQDMHDNDVYFVKGKIATVSSKKFLCDLEGNTLYVIKRKVFSLFGRTAYVCDKNETVVAKIRRKIFSLHDHYYIYSPKGEMTIRGNILEFNYNITLNGQEIGHVARKISLRDHFVLSLPDDSDYAFFIALVIAIDNITDNKDAQY
ncbi:MAG: LURP-one-related family protein [Acholeplasmatales bacterium]|nr:LURP-one-related family protein [Acholeplasmatales bacterium]